MYLSANIVQVCKMAASKETQCGRLCTVSVGNVRHD